MSKEIIMNELEQLKLSDTYISKEKLLADVNALDVFKLGDAMFVDLTEVKELIAYAPSAYSMLRVFCAAAENSDS